MPLPRHSGPEWDEDDLVTIVQTIMRMAAFGAIVLILVFFGTWVTGTADHFKGDYVTQDLLHTTKDPSRR